MKSPFSQEQITKVRAGIDKIAEKKNDFDERGLIIFRKDLEIPGDYRTNYVFEAITIYFPDDSDEIQSAFIQEFYKKYVSSVSNEKNYLIVQKLQTNFLKEIQLYDKALKYDEDRPIASSYFTEINDKGIVFSSEGITSPLKTDLSFRYSQMYSCIPNDVKLVKEQMPEFLKGAYRDDEACLGITIHWHSHLKLDLLCSLNTNLEKAKIERAIINATIFKKCFEQAMEIMVNYYKNNNNTLIGLKLEIIEKVKFLETLNQIKKTEYEKYTHPLSSFCQNYLFIKNLYKKMLKELAQEDKETEEYNKKNQAREDYSPEEKREYTPEEIKELSKLDIMDFTVESKLTHDSSLTTMREIHKKYKKLLKEVESILKEEEGRAQPVLNEKLPFVNAISSGSIIHKEKYAVEESVDHIMNTYQKDNSKKLMSYSQLLKVVDFARLHSDFLGYLRDNDIEITDDVINDLSFYPIEELWKIYKKKVRDKKFYFVYEKPKEEVEPKPKIHTIIPWGKSPLQDEYKEINTNPTPSIQGKGNTSNDNKSNSNIFTILNSENDLDYNSKVNPIKEKDKNRIIIEGKNYPVSKYKDIDDFPGKKIEITKQIKDNYIADEYEEPPVEAEEINKPVVVPPKISKPNSFFIQEKEENEENNKFSNYPDELPVNDFQSELIPYDKVEIL